MKNSKIQFWVLNLLPTFAFVFLLSSCLDDHSVEPDQQKFVFEELTHLVPDHFDFKNEEQINALLAEVDDDLLEKLEAGSLIVNYLEENNLTLNQKEIFGKKIPNLKALESKLSSSQFDALKTEVTVKKGRFNNCTICILIGGNYCDPLFPTTICPIMWCFNQCQLGQVCRKGQCIDPPITCPDDPCPLSQVCVGGVCQNLNPCQYVLCPMGEFCEDGICITDPNYNSCDFIICPINESCINGICVK